MQNGGSLSQRGQNANQERLENERILRPSEIDRLRREELDKSQDLYYEKKHEIKDDRPNSPGRRKEIAEKQDERRARDAEIERKAAAAHAEYNNANTPAHQRKPSGPSKTDALVAYAIVGSTAINDRLT